jgi:hypothetical protein
MVGLDAPPRALCERKIIVIAPPRMRSSSSPGSWPPSGVYVRYLGSNVYPHLETSKFFPEYGNLPIVASWTFLTAHARVLLCVARDPGVRLRDIAASLDITERTAFAIITDLAEAGYVVKEKDGRRNRYRIQTHLPLPEPAARDRTVGELLALLAGAEETAT